MVRLPLTSKSEIIFTFDVNSTPPVAETLTLEFVPVAWTFISASVPLVSIVTSWSDCILEFPDPVVVISID